jgi:hypothetical protein
VPSTNVHGMGSNAEDPKDRLCLLEFRRAILDSFWARETAMVDANRREAKRYLFDASLMGIVRPYPKWRLFIMEDEWGIGPATVLLMRSLEKGKNAEFVHPVRDNQEGALPFFKCCAHSARRDWGHVHHVGQRGERDHS